MKKCVIFSNVAVQNSFKIMPHLKIVLSSSSFSFRKAMEKYIWSYIHSPCKNKIRENNKFLSMLTLFLFIFAIRSKFRCKWRTKSDTLRYRDHLYARTESKILPQRFSRPNTRKRTPNIDSDPMLKVSMFYLYFGFVLDHL